MTFPSPLQSLIEQEGKASASATDDGGGDSQQRPGAAIGQRPSLEPEWLPWGPGVEDAQPPMLLATLGSIELEYAAIRRSVARFDAVHRGTVRLTGNDRLDLLDRLLTQQVCSLKAGDVAEAFLLDRKGRVQSDLVVVHLDDATWLDVDVHQAAATAAGLEAMCFGEDVTIETLSTSHHRIELHGPLGDQLIAQLGFSPMEPMHAAMHQANVCWRIDRLGVPGYALCVPSTDAAALWSSIAEASGALASAGRTVGWYAFNMARVEATEPMANIDFGPGNLPAETGVLDRRVSFIKGCYPGQEIVARMHNLGHPKQILRCLVIEGDQLPIAGAQLFAGDDAQCGSPLGAVTSSAPAPLAGSTPAVMAMVRWSIAEPGTSVQVMAEGAPVQACVQAISAVAT
jgi:folate-binding protein YgfZ